MKDELRHGSLDAEFSISDERARELLAQIAKGDAERPFTELAAAYGNEMRGILGARVLDKTEREAEEDDFWAKVVQIAGKYDDKWPAKHWLSKIAKNQAVDSYRRLRRRRKRVLFRAEMAAKMPEDGKEDDLDWERLADKDAVAALRSVQPDEMMEREENKAAARRLVRFLEQSEDFATRLIFRRSLRRGRILQANGGGGTYHPLIYARASLPRHRFRTSGSRRCVSGGRFRICEEAI